MRSIGNIGIIFNAIRNKPEILELLSNKDSKKHLYLDGSSMLQSAECL
jgi:hypothetical protein